MQRRAKHEVAITLCHRNASIQSPGPLPFLQRQRDQQHSEDTPRPFCAGVMSFCISALATQNIKIGQCDVMFSATAKRTSYTQAGYESASCGLGEFEVERRTGQGLLSPLWSSGRFGAKYYGKAGE